MVEQSPEAAWWLSATCSLFLSLLRIVPGAQWVQHYSFCFEGMLGPLVVLLAGKFIMRAVPSRVAALEPTVLG